MSALLLDAPAVAVEPAGPLRGRVAAPASKSVTNRLLLIAALADGTSRLTGPLHSDDSAAMRDVVAGLGAEVTGRADWAVAGVAGRPATPSGPLNCRLSGTTLRFATAAATLAAGPVTLTGLPPLRRRPIGPLVAVLRALGARLAARRGRPPVHTAGGGLDGGTVTVDASGSSQYASAVLLSAPYARRDVEVSIDGAAPLGYVTLTTDLMARWGAEVERLAAARWRVAAGRGYRAHDTTVEYDASAAAHLFALAVASAGEVTVTNAAPSTTQPDAQIVDVLQRFGGAVTRDGDAVTVAGPEEVTPAGLVDLAAMPDQVTTVACLAALAAGPTEITGVAVTRGHETDRLAALATELRKVGAAVQERADGLLVDGTGTAGRARLATHHDHRLAMSFAALAARLPAVVIADPGCVAKTYPQFWDALRSLGAQVRAA